MLFLSERDNIFASAFEAEPMLIGCLLTEPSLIADLAEVARPEDFDSAPLRAVFSSALRLWREGAALDTVSIFRGAQGQVDAKYLAQLMELTVTTADAVDLAREVHKGALRRQLFGIGERLQEDVATLCDPQEAISAAQGALEALDGEDHRRELLSPTEQLSGFLALRESVDAGAKNFAATGFQDLDTLLGGGLLCGGLYILAARPGVGKTTFALAVADQIAEWMGDVLFVSLEMDADQLTAKRLSRITAIPAHRLLTDKLESAEYDAVVGATGELAKRPLHINRGERLTVAQIDVLARRLPGLRCIVIDYLGLIRPGERYSSRYEGMTAISGDLKALARRRKVPVLCLAQLNRANVERKDKRPQLSDLRDTGAIEQDADGVMFLHREDYFGPSVENKKPWDPIPVELILAKNRHAGVGRIDFAFYLASGRFAPAKYGG